MIALGLALRSVAAHRHHTAAYGCAADVASTLIDLN